LKLLAVSRLAGRFALVDDGAGHRARQRDGARVGVGVGEDAGLARVADRVRAEDAIGLEGVDQIDHPLHLGLPGRGGARGCRLGGRGPRGVDAVGVRDGAAGREAAVEIDDLAVAPVAPELLARQLVGDRARVHARDDDGVEEERLAGRRRRRQLGGQRLGQLPAGVLVAVEPAQDQRALARLEAPRREEARLDGQAGGDGDGRRIGVGDGAGGLVRGRRAAGVVGGVRDVALLRPHQLRADGPDEVGEARELPALDDDAGRVFDEMVDAADVQRRARHGGRPRGDGWSGGAGAGDLSGGAIGLALGGIVGVADGQPLRYALRRRRAAAAARLLHDVSQLVRQQVAAGARVGREGAGAEEDVVAHGEGARAQPGRVVGGARVGVDAHVVEPPPEARLEVAAQRRGEGAAAGARGGVQRRGGGRGRAGVGLALDGARLVVAGARRARRGGRAAAVALALNRPRAAPDGGRRGVGRGRDDAVGDQLRLPLQRVVRQADRQLAGRARGRVRLPARRRAAGGGGRLPGRLAGRRRPAERWREAPHHPILLVFSI
jgi:hypothetical protein